MTKLSPYVRNPDRPRSDLELLDHQLRGVDLDQIVKSHEVAVRWLRVTKRALFYLACLAFCGLSWWGFFWFVGLVARCIAELNR
jgi:hypothetical protein